MKSSSCWVAANQGKRGTSPNMLGGKRGMSLNMLGGKKGFSMAPSAAPSESNSPSSFPSAAPSVSNAPSSSPSDAGTCDSDVAQYFLSTTQTTFAAAMNLAPGRPQCTLTPIADNAELQKILTLVDPLPGNNGMSAWVGIMNEDRMAGDTTDLLEGWTNINDGSAVPPFDNLWRRNEPNNSSAGPQKCAHVFGTQGDNSQTKLAGYLRDVVCEDFMFLAVYKCCDGGDNPFDP